MTEQEQLEMMAATIAAGMIADGMAKDGVLPCDSSGPAERIAGIAVMLALTIRNEVEKHISGTES